MTRARKLPKETSAEPGDPPDEVCANGLRNPWRLTFDHATGEVFIGNEGQDLWEEVDLEPGSSPGGRNSGSKDVEGTLYRLVPRPPLGACQPSDTVLGLKNGRFSVSLTWRPPQGRTGPSDAVPLSHDSGYLWLFRPDSLEVFAKLPNACFPPFHHIWFFAAGLTNVEVRIVVRDTASGKERR